MSKLQRKPPAVTPPDFEPERKYAVDETPMTNVLAEQAAAQKKDLAKVMTDQLTPLCPFCKSPKLSAITTPNPWGRKWVCGNCCSAFREPIRRKLA